LISLFIISIVVVVGCWLLSVIIFTTNGAVVILMPCHLAFN